METPLYTPVLKIQVKNPTPKVSFKENKELLEIIPFRVETPPKSSSSKKVKRKINKIKSAIYSEGLLKPVRISTSSKTRLPFNQWNSELHISKLDNYSLTEGSVSDDGIAEMPEEETRSNIQKSID